VAPTPSGIALQLTTFSLSYSFGEIREPSTSEIGTAVSVTRTYLNGFAKQKIKDLLELSTRRATEVNATSQPLQIKYNSTAFFEPEASFVPSVGEMDLLVTLAFSGENLRSYIALLRELPADNIFSTVTDVSDSKFRAGPMGSNKDPASEQDGRGSSKVALGASLGAGSFLAVLLSIAICRRRQNTYDKLGKGAILGGHMTVAGETYMGSSTVYSTSEAASRLHNARLADDNQSDWGISTRGALTEDNDSDPGDQSVGYHQDPLETQLRDFPDYGHLDPLGQPSGEFSGYDHLGKMRDDFDLDSEAGRLTANTISDEQSEDANVPTRVVDLIRMFSPLRNK